MTADKRLLRVSLAVVISNQLTALAYLSVADTTLQERLRPLSQSPDRTVPRINVLTVH